MDILETHAYYMRQKRNTTCILFLSLVPFFLATGAYFYLNHHGLLTGLPGSPDAPTAMAAGVKAAPVFLLAVIVLSWSGMQSVPGVAGGLVFSSAGDWCLVWPELFFPGMGAFAVAHVLYSFAFISNRYSTYTSSGSTCSRLMYVVLFVLGGGVYVHLYPYLQKLPDPGILSVAVGVYVGLIALMGGLALQTRRAAPMLGGLSFIVSDLALAFQIFKVLEDVEHGNSIVMVSYYLAQLLIALGDIQAVDNTDDLGKWKRA